MNKSLNIIKEDIHNIIKKTNIIGMEKLHQSLNHHFNESGKMLRPLFMILVNKDIGGNFENIRNFAVALELIHNYSLIHDDLPSIDNDDYRRNQLTVHKKFGEDVAILTGDFLLTKAFEISTINDKFNENTLKAIHTLAYNSNERGMVGGQYLDLNPSFLKDKENVLEMYKLKTSALFKTSFVIPGILNGLPKNELELLEDLGEKFGIYFQIKDDLSDIEEDKKVGKITILKYIEEDIVKEMLLDLREDIFNKLDKLNLKETKKLIIDLYE